LTWARYTYAINSKARLPAGLYSAAVIALGGFSIISYTENHWMLMPAAAGAFVGTVLAVHMELRNRAP
jgi:hypothetical protein